MSPARAGLAVSVLLRPGEAVPATRYGWLPLLAGVALVDAVRRLTDLDAVLKWPNDLLVPTGGDGNGAAGYGKCAGVLAEAAPNTVVVGVGLNVTVRADELPEPQPGGLPATSLLLAGARATDRDPLLRALLRTFADWYDRWRDTGGDADACGLHEVYVRACATVGRTVRVRLPGGGELAGAATGIDGDGRLIVQTSAGEAAVAAGDVLHVR
jgi:BirA family biotin operon repressor/biotin-[acetyl-CoA-carboxylase] ligase